MLEVISYSIENLRYHIILSFQAFNIILTLYTFIYDLIFEIFKSLTYNAIQLFSFVISLQFNQLIPF